MSENGEAATEPATRAPVRPRYAPDTAGVRSGREDRPWDGEAKVRLVHLLAAFGPGDSELMRRLMTEHDFDQTAWRAALAERDRASDGRSARRPEDTRVLSVDDAASTLAVHSQTIRTYIRSGQLPAYRIGGERVIRIFASDLYDLLEPLEPETDRDEGPT